MRKLPLKALGAALAALAVSCTSPSAESSADRQAIAIKNIAYDPGAVEIDKGTEVVWSNEDASVTHTVTSGSPGEEGVPGLSDGEAPTADGTFDGTLDADTSTFTFTFEDAGEYEYFCRVHPSMTATVVVR